MALADDDIKLIEGWVQGRLNASEIQQVEVRRRDPEFESQLQLHQRVQRASRSWGRANLLKTFQGWDQEDLAHHKPGTKMAFRWQWAAVALVLLASAIWIFFLYEKQSPQTLFADYYEKYPNLIDPISKGSTRDVISISQLYESGDYATAVLRQPGDSLQQYYQALSQIELGRLDRAEVLLRQISEDQTHRFHEGARWNLALVYVKENKMKEAYVILLQISTSEHHAYTDQAARLRRDLEVFLN